MSLDTSLGLPLFLSVKNVVPYMDGYKVTLDIGNPNNATIKDAKLTIDWWLSSYFSDGFWDYGEDSLEVKQLKESKSKTQNLLTDIAGGKWNRVELTIPSMTEKDAKSFRIMLEASIISMY